VNSVTLDRDAVLAGLCSCALCLVVLLALVPAPLAWGASDDLAADPGSLLRVSNAFRPRFRWWWPADSVQAAELRKELRAIKGVGFGAVEQSLLFNGMDWGTPAFRARTRTALKEADALGIKLDVTLGPGWPISSPVTEDLSKELSSQSLHYGAVELNGPTTFTGFVPDNPPGVSGQPRRLIAVTAMRVVAGDKPQTLDPQSAVDLTASVKSDGTLSWSVPEGRWKLFGFWMRPSLMRGKTGGGSEGWYVVDHFSRRAINRVLRDFDQRLFGGNMAPLFRRNAGDVFEDSYEVERGPAASGQTAELWTPALLAEFKRRRGYDLSPLVPGLFREFTFPDDLAERLKSDYEETLTDLLIDEHIDRISRWAGKRGLGSRSQAYQAGLGEVGRDDNSRLAAAAANPDVESFGFGDPTFGQFTPVAPGSSAGRAVVDRYRQVVSGAHLSGRKEISNEWGAVIGGQYQVQAGALKGIADRSLAAGVSRMVMHAFAYRLYDRPAGATEPRPNWPGWCAYCTGPFKVADSWNQLWPQFKAFSGLTSYLGRAGAALRSGRPRVDLTLLNATSAVNGTPTAPPASGTPDDVREALEGGGYTWDVLDPLDIRRVGGVSGGRLLPRGPAYKALVIDDMEALPSATAKRLDKLARKGLRIVIYGQVPDQGMGYRNAAGEDAAVKAAVARLRGRPNVRLAATPSELVAALRALSINPDLGQGAAATVIPLHRRTAKGDVWFMYNDSTQRTTRNFTFATTGAPAQIDLWTGRATRLGQYTRRKGRVTVPLSIDAAGTTVLSFDRRRTGGVSVTSTSADSARFAGSRLVLRDLSGGSQTATMSDGRRISVAFPALSKPRTIPGPWGLDARTVQPSGDGRVQRTLSALVDWSQIPGLQGKSGTGTYTASVSLPAKWVKAGRGALLDPGAFAGALRVWINGRRARIPTVPGQPPTDITRPLRAGKNALRLEVSTTLTNAMRAQSLLGDPDYPSAIYGIRPIQPAGLTGPVRLIPYAEEQVKT
jgi:hypothetical protein